jgi:hypothetical protein
MKIAEPAKRLVGCLFFAAGVFAYVMLFRLGASPAGHGTHTQLGLPACSYLATKHYPCPGCGVTTAAVAMSHGRIFDALNASVFGAFAFLAIMTLGAAGLLQAVTGRDVLKKFKPRPWVVLLIVILFFASWGLKTGLGVLEGRYPIK